MEDIEADIGLLREETKRWWPTSWGHWMDETFVLKIFRQLAIRERSEPDTFNTVLVPRGCTHPHTQGKLWTTSAWNWLWVVTHLGNHREEYGAMWRNLHQWALTHPGSWTSDWEFLHNNSDCRHWVHWMSQELSDYIQEGQMVHPSPIDNDTDYVSSQEYVTQPDTPQWELPSDTDSDSESVPSSLDNFLNETFGDGYALHSGHEGSNSEALA